MVGRPPTSIDEEDTNMVVLCVEGYLSNTSFVVSRSLKRSARGVTFLGCRYLQMISINSPS
jgi:hypothetical protein